MVASLFGEPLLGLLLRQERTMGQVGALAEDLKDVLPVEGHLDPDEEQDLAALENMPFDHGDPPRGNGGAP